MRKCTNCDVPLPMKTMKVNNCSLMINHRSYRAPSLQVAYKATYTCAACHAVNTFEYSRETDPAEIAIIIESLKNIDKE